MTRLHEGWRLDTITRLDRIRRALRTGQPAARRKVQAAVDDLEEALHRRQQAFVGISEFLAHLDSLDGDS